MGANALVRNGKAEKFELALVAGDLSGLSTEERLAYYKATCDSIGVNPLTKPFDYISLNGKLVMYAKRDCTDQLRKVHKVSIKLTEKKLEGDIYTVTAQATAADGRCDESTGAVNIANLKGDSLANAYMKAETKAKRRVTLSICGLGILDESEVDSVPGVRVAMPEMETLEAHDFDMPTEAEETDDQKAERWAQLFAATETMEQIEVLRKEFYTTSFSDELKTAVGKHYVTAKHRVRPLKKVEK